MKRKTGMPYLMIIACLILISLLAASCGGSPEDPWGDQDADDYQPTSAASGLGSGPAEEPEDETAEQEGDDIGLVPLVSACASRKPDHFSFGIAYQRLTWFGPPTVKIGPGGFMSVIEYTYDNETKSGVFQLITSGPSEMPIEVTFPACRSDPFNTSVKFQARVEGTCKDDQVSLTVYEIWDSVSVDIPCEANSEVCGDDPCPYPLILPFAFAGEQGITVKFDLDPMTGKILEGEKQLPFMGVGASGTKTYTLFR